MTYFYLYLVICINLLHFGDGKQLIVHRKESGDYLIQSTEEECKQYGNLSVWDGQTGLCVCQQKSTFFSLKGVLGCYIGKEPESGM